MLLSALGARLEAKFSDKVLVIVVCVQHLPDH